jgi:hypothetical protein
MLANLTPRHISPPLKAKHLLARRKPGSFNGAAGVGFLNGFAIHGARGLVLFTTHIDADTGAAFATTNS